MEGFFFFLLVIVLIAATVSREGTSHDPPPRPHHPCRHPDRCRRRPRGSEADRRTGINEPGTLDLAGIRARAEAATCGSWQPHVTRDGIQLLYAEKFIDDDGIPAAFPYDVCLCNGGKMDEDAAHIAGMDPPTTIALVDEVERLGRELSNVTRNRDAIARGEATALEMMAGERARAVASFDGYLQAEAETAKLRARVAELEDALAANTVLEERVAAAERDGMEYAAAYADYMAKCNRDVINNASEMYKVVYRECAEDCEDIAAYIRAALPPASTTTDPGQPRIDATSQEAAKDS